MYILDTRRDRVCTLNCGASYIEDESRHWDLSSDVIKFSYWHIKGFFKATFDQKKTFFRVTTLWLITNHTISHRLGPIFFSFLLVFVILIAISV